MRTKCWNCSSDKYVETISREHCPACGISCDYHGAGANERYDEAHERSCRRSEEAMEKLLDRLGY